MRRDGLVWSVLVWIVELVSEVKVIMSKNQCIIILGNVEFNRKDNERRICHSMNLSKKVFYRSKGFYKIETNCSVCGYILVCKRNGNTRWFIIQTYLEQHRHC